MSAIVADSGVGWGGHDREFFLARKCPCDWNMSPPQLRETDTSPTPPPKTGTPAGEIGTFVPPTPPSQTLFFNLENPICLLLLATAPDPDIGREGNMAIAALLACA